MQRLSVLKKNHADEQYLARRNLRDLPGTIGRLSQRLTDLTADRATATAHAGDRVTIANRDYLRDDVQGALGDYLHSLPERVMQTQRFALGTYRGLRFGMVLNPQFSPEVYLERATTRQDTLSREHHGPRAILNALERLAGGYGSECTRVQQDLSIAEAQLRDYQARLGMPFPHDSYLSSLTALRDQLKAGLSGGYGEPTATEPSRTASELAQQIKALKAAHTIEATPERAGKRRTEAEEPVTARIRRRTEAIPAADPATPPEATASPTGASLPSESTAQAIPGDLAPSGHAGTTQDSSNKSKMTFQERVAKNLRRKEQEPSLF